MNVRIKTFSVEMPVKSSGIEFEVRSTDGAQLGDCFLTMTGLTWCKGRIKKENGIKISWEQFIELMQSKATVSAAVKAARQE